MAIYYYSSYLIGGVLGRHHSLVPRSIPVSQHWGAWGWGFGCRALLASINWPRMLACFCSFLPSSALKQAAHKVRPIRGFDSIHPPLLANCLFNLLSTSESSVTKSTTMPWSSSWKQTQSDIQYMYLIQFCGPEKVFVTLLPPQIMHAWVGGLFFS